VKDEGGRIKVRKFEGWKIGRLESYKVQRFESGRKRAHQGLAWD
jgi:hypothetical protein